MKIRIGVLCILLIVINGCNKESPKEKNKEKELVIGSAKSSLLSAKPKLSSVSNFCIFDSDILPENRCQLLAPAYQCSSILKSAADLAPPAEKIMALAKLAKFELANGSADKAIEYFQQAYEYAVEKNDPMARDILQGLAVAQLRQGESANCRDDYNADRCIVPLNENAVHANQSGSRGAIQTLQQLLKMNPEDPYLRWLLNLAYMTIGEHPDKVPMQYLIPVTAFQSSEIFPHFNNIAPQLGISRKGLTGGVVIDDFTNDGYLDIVYSSNGFCDPVIFMVNNGKNGFDDKSQYSGLAEQYNASHMIQADYDNDGLLDLYITRGIWQSPVQSNMDEISIPVYNSLMRNKGNGQFEDVSEKMGLKVEPNYNIASTWADFDNDGFIDLFVCNNIKQPQLFMNNKGKSFTLVTDSGLYNNGICMGVAAGDVNNNGSTDIFLSVHSGESLLFLNDGHAHFTSSASMNGLIPIGSAFSTWFSDYDNNGDLDLFVTAWGGDNALQNIGRLMTRQPFKIDHLTVLRNSGDGNFSSVDLGLDEAIMVMGSNVGDFNNDGFEDMLLGTGGPDFEFQLPNRAFLNKGGKGFVDVTFAGGFGNVQKGHGIAFADFDNDGDQDVMASFGGWFETDRFMPSVYQNPGFSNNWITLVLQGTTANRSAIGAKITLELMEAGKKRQVHRVIGSGGSFGSNSLQAEIGLGKAQKIQRLTIQWPGSNKPMVLQDLAVNQKLKITEGQAGVLVLNESIVDFSVKRIEKTERHHEHMAH